MNGTTQYSPLHSVVAIIGERGSQKLEIVTAICERLSSPFEKAISSGTAIRGGRIEDRYISVFDVPPVRENPDVFAKCVGMADLCVVVLDPQRGMDKEIKEQMFVLHWLDIDNIYFAVVKTEGANGQQLDDFDQEIYDFIWNHCIDSEHYILSVSKTDVSDIFDLFSSDEQAEEVGDTGQKFRLDIFDAPVSAAGNAILWGKVRSGSAEIGDEVEIQANGRRQITQIRKASSFGRNLKAIKPGGIIALELADHPEFLTGNACTVSSPGHISYRSYFDRVVTIIFPQEKVGEKIELWDGKVLDICFRFGATTAKVIFPHVGDTLTNGDDALLVGFSFSVPVPVVRDDRFFILHSGNIVGMGRIC